ncbi:MAG: hypothetical protein EPN48_07435 [Microbacteriaceae bacterium]|nr:MAG: hypothetical protein EPN48_07435 [Microbacteriaceae bacterium]
MSRHIEDTSPAFAPFAEEQRVQCGAEDFADDVAEASEEASEEAASSVPCFDKQPLANISSSCRPRSTDST